MSLKGGSSNAAMVSRADLRAKGQPLSSLEYQHTHWIFYREVLRPAIPK